MNRNWPKTKNIESIHVEAATLKQLFHILVTGSNTEPRQEGMIISPLGAGCQVTAEVM